MSLYRIGVEASSPARAFLVDEKKPTTPFGEILKQVSKWMPAETLAIFAPGIVLLQGDVAEGGAKPSPLFLGIMIVVTYLFVLASTFSTGKSLTSRVHVNAGLATVAFTIWSFSVPSNGWQAIGFVAKNAGFVAVAGAIAGVLFSFVAQGIEKRAGPL